MTRDMYASKMWYAALLAYVVCVSAYTGPDLPPGPYCGTTNMCCDGRRDDCSHPIMGTLCYCDQFCNRTNSHDDCCPDYKPICKGEIASPVVFPCKHKGKFYYTGDKREENCNQCTCVAATETLNRWECTNDPCLVSDEVYEGVNRQRGSWRATKYPQFWGKKLKQGLDLKLGTQPVNEHTKHMLSIKYENNLVLPASFDARKKWPRSISPVYDQGWCGSDWAVSTAAIASDRFGIQSRGAEVVQLSAQHLLACNERGQRGCGGGHIDRVWGYLSRYGIVDEECFPYQGRNNTVCHIPPKISLNAAGCRAPRNPARSDRYKTGVPRRLSTSEDIMNDLLSSGPVQAIMRVHHDFFHYQDGIYRHTQFGEPDSKLHSVRIIGWGEERGDKYWLVANSWGTEWGENGYFRIARGDSEIESFVVTVLAFVTEVYRNK